MCKPPLPWSSSLFSHARAGQDRHQGHPQGDQPGEGGLCYRVIDTRKIFYQQYSVAYLVKRSEAVMNDCLHSIAQTFNEREGQHLIEKSSLSKIPGQRWKTPLCACLPGHTGWFLCVNQNLDVNVLSSIQNLKDGWSVGCVDEPFHNMVFFSTRAMFPALTYSPSPTRLPKLRGPRCYQLPPCSTSNKTVIFDL